MLSTQRSSIKLKPSCVQTQVASKPSQLA